MKFKVFLVIHCARVDFRQPEKSGEICSQNFDFCGGQLLFSYEGGGEEP